MARYALVSPQDVIDRFANDGPGGIDPNVGTKPGWKWLPCPHVAKPAYDQATELIEGPTYTVGQSSVTEAWSKRAMTAQEISDAKDEAVSRINGSVFPAQAKIILELENEIRQLRTRVNALIDATGQSATVTKFTAGQAGQITMAQLKAAIKALL